MCLAMVAVSVVMLGAMASGFLEAGLLETSNCKANQSRIICELAYSSYWRSPSWALCRVLALWEG